MEIVNKDKMYETLEKICKEFVNLDNETQTDDEYCKNCEHCDCDEVMGLYDSTHDFTVSHYIDGVSTTHSFYSSERMSKDEIVEMIKELKW